MTLKKFAFCSALILAAMIGAVGCSTARVSVLPGDDYNRVVAHDIEGDDAEQASVKAANEYCEQRGQEAKFLSTNAQYTGTMDEQNRQAIRNASKAAMILGGGGPNAPLGGAMGTAGQVGYSMTSNRDYKSEVHFKCR
jgi:hypothetical protein